MLDEKSLRRLRAEFPILNQRINGKSLIYLDNAATTQKPRSVIDATNQFYRRTNANVHRAAHHLAQAATEHYEQARHKLATYLGVAPSQLVWTSGTTEAINLVAQSFLQNTLRPGDRIVLARSNHHANILPWQQVVERIGAHIDVIELDDQGDMDLAQYRQLLEREPKLVAVSQVSNVLGTIYPVEQICSLARSAGALTFIDAAQSLPHFETSPAALGADFFALSGHKLFGPTGVGALWARADLLEMMPPWKTGGEMIERVSFEKTHFASPPHRFEAGTPNIAGVIGFGAAIDFLSSQDREQLRQHEAALSAYLREGLDSISGLKRLPSGSEQVGVFSFTHGQEHAQDLAAALDQQGIALRAGYHCAQPLLTSLGVESALRASLSFYNSLDEIEQFIEKLDQATAPQSVSQSATTETLKHQVIAACSWPERYNALLRLGGALPLRGRDLRSDQWEIPGCETRVWIKLVLNDSGRIRLETDAQAKGVRALLALISDRLDGLSIEEIDLDQLRDWLESLGFEKHLSRTRGNAVKKLLAQIEQLLSAGQ